MNVSLTPELEKLVNGKVSSGMYHTASEVIRDALRLLQERDQRREAELASVRAKVNTGWEQLERGEGRPFDDAAVERIKAAGRQRLAAKRRKAS
jgi:antitoxin ParD1/3/4